MVMNQERWLELSSFDPEELLDSEAVRELQIMAFYHGLSYDKSLTFIEKVKILDKEFKISEKIKINLKNKFENYNPKL